jgi:hypothetical protein
MSPFQGFPFVAIPFHPATRDADRCRPFRAFIGFQSAPKGRNMTAMGVSPSDKNNNTKKALKGRNIIAPGEARQIQNAKHTLTLPLQQAEG